MNALLDLQEFFLQIQPEWCYSGPPKPIEILGNAHAKLMNFRESMG
jgi:hypothetical protein